MNTPTNVSPIETLYATSGAEKRRNVIKEDGIDRRELFSSLVNGASLSQIAYAGLSQEFNLTLSLQDNNFNGDLRAADQDISHNQVFTTTPDKRDTVTKLDNAPLTSDNEQPVEESIAENAAPQLENNYLSEPDVDQSPVFEVKDDRSINPAELAHDSTSITRQTPEMQVAATTTSRPESVIQGPREVARANNAANINQAQNRDPVALQVTKPEEISSNAVLRNAGNAKGNDLRAKVTEAPDELVSQPSANLAASATVSAQANQQNRVGGDPVRLPAGDLANDGDIALNGAVTRQGSKQGTANQQNNNSLNQPGTQAKMTLKVLHQAPNSQLNKHWQQLPNEIISSQQHLPALALPKINLASNRLVEILEWVMRLMDNNSPREPLTYHSHKERDPSYLLDS